MRIHIEISRRIRLTQKSWKFKQLQKNQKIIENRYKSFLKSRKNYETSKKFTKTLNGFTNGQTISYGCKFAFAGGLAVTKYFAYKVGDNCVLGIEDNVLAASIKLYPNPVKRVLNLNSPIKIITKVEIYSVIGNLVKSTTKNLNEINVEDLSSGLYLIKIFTLEGSVSKKLIKN